VSKKTTKAAGAAKNAPSPVGSAQAQDDMGGGNIDKVRDLLFGTQMRDYDRRFTLLDERLVQEMAELKDDVRKRLAALEQFVKQETASLADRIKTEHDERTDATKELSRDAREAAKAFEKKTGKLDDQIGKVERESRQQILELHQRMSDDLRQRIDDVLARLAKESAELRSEKTDRAALAALLTEMAMRLNNELSIPGLDDGRNG
jgi:HD-GYP domain-containing protein (c-di-GMP phosphodiesterase class II)